MVANTDLTDAEPLAAMWAADAASQALGITLAAVGAGQARLTMTVGP